MQPALAVVEHPLLYLPFADVIVSQLIVTSRARELNAVNITFSRGDTSLSQARTANVEFIVVGIKMMAIRRKKLPNRRLPCGCGPAPWQEVVLRTCPMSTSIIPRWGVE